MSQPPQQFCVRWNSYHTNLQTVFPKLLTTENFVDVTLACENRQIKCHKVVLSACSTYFERLLIQNPCKHPIIFMKDMRFSEMQSLVDFMYKGEVNVSQDDLPSLLKSAEALQIRGLCGSESAGGGSSSQDTPVAPSPQIAIPLLTNHAATDTSPRDSAEGNVNNNSAKPNPPPPPSPNASSNASSSPLSNGQAKRRRDGDGESSPEAGKTRRVDSLKQETVEEDGLYYGDIDLGEIECNDQGEEDILQTGTVSGQPSAEYAIANVMCEYDTSRSPSPTGTPVTSSIISNEDHNYNAQNLHVIDSCEPPAFIIKQDDPHAILSPNNAHLNQQLLAMSQKLLAATGSSQQHKPIQPQQPGPLHQQHGPSHQQQHSSLHQQHGSLHYSYGSSDPGNTKRIRRSEVLLKQAADCVSRGQTFQTVSDQFNIPISTIRFFMARKGILPRRKRGRSSAALPVSPNDPRHLSSTGQSQSSATPPSPTQPPYHMATYKLPDFDLGRVS